MRVFLASLFIIATLFFVPSASTQEECFGELECYDFEEFDDECFGELECYDFEEFDDECFGELECYDLDESSDQDSEPELWGGYIDGRLNPDPAEYYSIWCNADVIEVWRSVPSQERLRTIPILDAINIRGLGEAIDLGDTMQITRLSETLFGIYGSNGNTAPQAGQKLFDMNACIDRNGGSPESAPTPTPAIVVQSLMITPTSTPVPPPEQSETDSMSLFAAFAQVCGAPGLMMVMAPGLFSSWRRKRRQ